MIDENLLKYGVGLLLASFGTFWAVEGIGIFRAGRQSLAWPGGELAILVLLAVWFLLSPGVRRGAGGPRPDTAGVRAPSRRRSPDEILKAFGQFWYDFIIGDDWKIAAGVVLALAAAGGDWAALFGDPGLAVLGGAPRGGLHRQPADRRALTG